MTRRREFGVEPDENYLGDHPSLVSGHVYCSAVNVDGLAIAIRARCSAEVGREELQGEGDWQELTNVGYCGSVDI